ncbi:MAG: DUF3772 domain-containing protein [Hyphomicrobiales bacterium]|nr:DUF3772 domain-containing protein [Hyphomicrobiales bacterium]OQW80990.1 MAG: hypothetical protein BVN31_12395 [Proteobacteria bacterium ST_bin15]
MRTTRLCQILATILMCLAFAGAALATDATVKKRLDTNRSLVERLNAALQRVDLNQNELAGMRDELDGANDDLAGLVSDLEPDAKASEDRLKQIGPKPEAGQSEAPEITRDREAEAKNLSDLTAALRQARVLQGDLSQLSERISERRRDLFSRQIFEHTQSILDPSLWRDVAAALPRMSLGIGYLLSDWVALLGQTGNILQFSVFLMMMAVAGVLYRPARRRLLAAPRGGFFGAKNENKPTPLERALLAVWTALINAFLPVAAVFLIVRVLAGLELLPFRFRILADAIIYATAIMTGVRAIALTLFEPSRPAWRLLPMSDRLAQPAMASLTAIASVIAGFHLLQQFNNIIVVPLPVTLATFGTKALVFAITLATGLSAVAYVENAEHDERAKSAYGDPAPSSPLWRTLRLALWLAVVLVGGGALFGYIAFASFLAGQVVWAVIVLGALVIVLNLVDETVGEITRPDTRAGRRLAMMLGIDSSSITLSGILISGILRAFVTLVAVFMLVAPWGVDSRDALGMVRAAFFGVKIGGITLSLAALLGSLGVFTIGLIITRAVQRWLDQRFLPATRMDVGLRNSIYTGIGYIGIIIAAAIGFTYLGIDFQNLAIVAGALSVGIGFGLQSIVSNFVSGLILLAERPIKSGDLIVVGDAEGYVKRINVRATEIETFDRAVLIVPNSALVSGNVKNWMHNDLLGQAKIRVGVAHSVDPHNVRDLLVEIARAHPMILPQPSPKVLMSEITEGAMIFELRSVVANVDNVATVCSDLRFEIVRRFAEAGFVIR